MMATASNSPPVATETTAEAVSSPTGMETN